MSDTVVETVPNPDEDFVRPQQEDYFGFQETDRYTFPDNITYIEFKKMNEGEKARFQKTTQRDLVLERQSGNARLKVDPGGDRHALIETCAIGWNLTRQGEPMMFTMRNLKDFLELANPLIIEDLEKAIRKANPWLLAEMTVADIDHEIENLQEMREVALEREQGELSSANK